MLTSRLLTEGSLDAWTVFTEEVIKANCNVGCPEGRMTGGSFAKDCAYFWVKSRLMPVIRKVCRDGSWVWEIKYGGMVRCFAER